MVSGWRDIDTVGGYRGGPVPEGMKLPVPTSKGASVNHPLPKKRKKAKKKSDS